MKVPRASRQTAESRATETPAGSSNRTFWLSLVVIELCVFAVHLNGLRHKHLEGDEIIFTFMAERLAHDPLAYNLQGSLEGEPARRFIEEVWEPLDQRQYPNLQTAEVLRTPPDDRGRQSVAYDLDIYDKPLFNHPPLYAYSLTLFRIMFGHQQGVLLSALCHALTILFVALLGRMLASQETGLIAGGLVAIEAMSWICGERLWIDGMLETSVAGAMLAACWSIQRGGVRRFALAGVCLGAAGLAKLQAGLLAPAVLMVWLVSRRKPKIAEVVSYAAGCLALIVPWLILAKVKCGAFLPSVHPTEWMKANYPYIKMMVDRPAGYYLIASLLASPVLLYCLPALARIRRDRWLWIPIVWSGAFVIMLTIMGANGLGFQLRHLASIMPAVCLLAAAGIGWLPGWARVPVYPLAAYTLFIGVTTAAAPFMVDPEPASIARYLHAVFGLSLRDIFPGMW